jgi:glycosyltransferase involved in cell wall biosynthesis
MQAISAVIPSRNGGHLLSLSLPPLVAETGEAGEIIVVDDESTDGTADLLRERFPRVKRLAVSGASSFAELCNAGFAACSNGLVLLLNNDMVAARGFLEPLVRRMAGPRVFAAGPEYRMRRGFEDAYVCGSCGDLHKHSDNVTHRPSTRLDAPAAGGLFHADEFRRQGWRIVQEPRSVMYHEQAATIRRAYSRTRAEVIFAKNRFLFVWKNIRDPGLFAEHFARLPWRLAQDAAARGGLVMMRGLLAALPQVAEAAARRRQRRAVLSDRGAIYWALEHPRAFLSQVT